MSSNPNPQLSDSLELLHFLDRYAEDKSLIEPAIEQLDAYTDKWRDGTYCLFPKESQDEKALKDALQSALGDDPGCIEFVSAKDLMSQGVQRQHAFYRTAYDGNLARELHRTKKHEALFSRMKDVRSENRDLPNLVALSLGTRTLQPALDNTFGNSFGSIAKNDLIELWYCRFGYVLLGESAKAEELDALITLYRTAPTLGRYQKKPHKWLFWED